MRVVLQILVEVDLYTMTIARKIIASQVYKHHMLSILLRVGTQKFGCTTVCIVIASTLCCTCNWVYIRLAIVYAAMCLGRRTEYTESSKVEVKQVRTGINTSQGAV